MATSGLRRYAEFACEAAKSALAGRMASADLDGDRRCAHPEANLVCTVPPGRWPVIVSQLGGGMGGELFADGCRRREAARSRLAAGRSALLLFPSVGLRVSLGEV